MSLNRTEQMLFDYLQANPEERRHWEAKVKKTASDCSGDVHRSSMLLNNELWDYYRERSEVASPFRELVAREGLQRTSLRNLADYLIRLWAPPPPKKRPGGAANVNM